MFVSSVFVCCAGRGLFDELITRPEEPYWLYVFLIVCDVGTLTIWRPKPDLGCCTTGRKEIESLTTTGHHSQFYKTRSL
jgi:hypothetical protein